MNYESQYINIVSAKIDSGPEKWKDYFSGNLNRTAASMGIYKVSLPKLMMPKI